MTVLATTVHPWAWHAHPSVWVVIGLVSGLYAAAIRIVGARLGERATRRQITVFYTGVLLRWFAADWPMHDIAERYLFSVHMVQHIIFTLVVPPLLLVGTPPWLQRWLIKSASADGFVNTMAKPLVAGIIYNAVFVGSHYPIIVDDALHSEPLHFLVHCAIFFAALLMWFPVMNRQPEYPMMSPPTRMIYLFLQSVIPTVPASFLTFADGLIYRYYATVPHPFHLSAIADQQLAGALMKVMGGTILWGVIVVMFFRWYAEEHASNLPPRRDDLLTWDDVARELERTPPAPPEP